MNGLRLARAALSVLTGAGESPAGQAALLARIRVLVEDRLRATASGTEALRRLRNEPGDASTALATVALADEAEHDATFAALLHDLLEQLLDGPAAAQAYGTPPTSAPPTAVSPSPVPPTAVPPSTVSTPPGPPMPGPPSTAPPSTVSPSSGPPPAAPPTAVPLPTTVPLPPSPSPPPPPPLPPSLTVPSTTTAATPVPLPAAPQLPAGQGYAAAAGQGVTALGSIGLNAVTAHAIPFAPAEPDPAEEPAARPAPPAPQVVVVPPPPRPRPSTEQPVRDVFLPGLLAASGLALFGARVPVLLWLLFLVLALLGLIRARSALRRPLDVPLGVGLLLNLVLLILVLTAPPPDVVDAIAGLKI
ncbi:hypothetical protein ACFV7Q_15940 [Streptomyces sp. NPDC059851]|uniref:hypothetical protein n=1 Tax=Streptomyces sp. NPDC059851 TaxID=3346971 RepID=UPI003647AD64